MKRANTRTQILHKRSRNAIRYSEPERYQSGKLRTHIQDLLVEAKASRVNNLVGSRRTIPLVLVVSNTSLPAPAFNSYIRIRIRDKRGVFHFLRKMDLIVRRNNMIFNLRTKLRVGRPSFPTDLRFLPSSIYSSTTLTKVKFASSNRINNTKCQNRLL